MLRSKNTPAAIAGSAPCDPSVGDPGSHTLIAGSRGKQWLYIVAAAPGMRHSIETAPHLRARFQVTVRGNIGLGPGKADLLELIRDTGSIAEAASRMGMSYMRAWTLVRTMNECFREPLVVTERGGKEKGGSRLTPAGRHALSLYRRLEREANRATRSTWKTLKELLRSQD
jgi:molybdate transport system regulatory protein